MNIKIQNLLTAEYLIGLLIDEFKEIEQSHLIEEFDIESEEAIEELLDSFKYLDFEIKNNAKAFFPNFFLLIQQAPYILDPNILINRFKESFQLFNRLNNSIKESDLEEKENLLEFIEDYGLTIENRLMAIENEQKFFKQHLPHCTEESVKVIREESSAKLILTIQNTPNPLIGLEELLNYQVLQIIEINNLIYAKLKEQVNKHNLKTIYIDCEHIFASETIAEFHLQLSKDKQDILDIQRTNSFDQNTDLELILDIAAELATNLIYRLHWDEKYEVLGLE